MFQELSDILEIEIIDDRLCFRIKQSGSIINTCILTSDQSKKLIKDLYIKLINNSDINCPIIKLNNNGK